MIITTRKDGRYAEVDDAETFDSNVSISQIEIETWTASLREAEKALANITPGYPLDMRYRRIALRGLRRVAGELDGKKARHKP